MQHFFINFLKNIYKSNISENLIDIIYALLIYNVNYYILKTTKKRRNRLLISLILML